jgi:hypothetical protein
MRSPGITRTIPELRLHSEITNRAIIDSADYAVENFNRALMFGRREDLWRYCFRETPRQGLVLEFGVWEGVSINYFSRLLPQGEIFGFDSFEGLEEDWYGYNTPKGYFDLKGRLPKVRDNVTLFKGWFENTLPDFLSEISGRRIDILHLDADTYTPTKFVLHTLRKNLGHGSIIIFDEYFGYPNWRSHEFLAFQEFISENSMRYVYIGYVEMQVAVKILSD